ncbi:hypothetical protein EJ05DRAFT_503039 [Pseudovirgaria hyperparasitica]|uniref:Uncharacterized protein n=1 Tax=Pseudovirgaria hyperparasitica TaxID=470096 RepID=A0A6A6W0X9_9PEZI|nr:uncharacterized protein EJ05DRAFT_503039 [Pseudovirgaria hyperparasitica]KAF2755580.1 hypothetical protein EJ05DRAFT_503039 [Pseudovirgaria hyperparasitica]
MLSIPDLRVDVDYIRSQGIFSGAGTFFLKHVVTHCRARFLILIHHRYCPEELRELLQTHGRTIDRVEAYVLLVHMDGRGEDTRVDGDFLQYHRVLKLACIVLEYTGELLELALPAGKQLTRSGTSRSGGGHVKGLKIPGNTFRPSLRRPKASYVSKNGSKPLSMVLTLLQNVLSLPSEKFRKRIWPDGRFNYLDTAEESVETMAFLVEENCNSIKQRYGQIRSEDDSRISEAEREKHLQEERCWAELLHSLSSCKADSKIRGSAIREKIREKFTEPRISWTNQEANLRYQERWYWRVLKLYNLILVMLSNKASSMRGHKVPDRFDILSVHHLLEAEGPHADRYMNALRTSRLLDSLQLANDGLEFWETPETFDWTDVASVSHAVSQLDTAINGSSRR